MKKTAPVQFVPTARVMSLTEREREVLTLFAAGDTYVVIGEKLGVSSKTVGSYLQRVREKYRTKTRADLIALAVSEGLLADGKKRGR